MTVREEALVMDGLMGAQGMLLEFRRLINLTHRAKSHRGIFERCKLQPCKTSFGAVDDYASRVASLLIYLSDIIRRPHRQPRASAR